MIDISLATINDSNELYELNKASHDGDGLSDISYISNLKIKCK